MSAPPRTSEEAARRLPPWLRLGGEAAWRIIAIVVVGWLLLELLGRVRLLAISFLIAAILTALLAPLTRLLRKRMPRTLAAILPIVLAIGMVASVVTLFTRGLIDQWDALVQSARGGWDRIAAWIDASPLPDDVTQRMTAPIGAEQAVRTVTTTLEVVSGALLVLVVTFFLLRDGERIASAAVRVLHGERRERARRAAKAAWHTLERYIVGIAAISAINTALTAVALVALDIPMVLPLVLFTFVACFVPFIGTIVANVAGALVALAERGPEIALIFLAVGVAIEVLESNVTQPLIQGRALHVHPLLVIAVVTAGTVAFGIPGAFLAVPALAVTYGAAKSARDDATGEGEGSETEPSSTGAAAPA